MIPLHTMMRHLRRLTREQRIKHLQLAVWRYPARSQRRQLLEAMLRDDMTAQLRKEVRAS